MAKIASIMHRVVHRAKRQFESELYFDKTVIP